MAERARACAYVCVKLTEIIFIVPEQNSDAFSSLYTLKG